MQRGPVRRSAIRCSASASGTERLITGTRLNEHITPILGDTLHWLPVTQRIENQIALMTYSCVYGTSLAYLHGICRPVASVEGLAMLRSANFGELVEPRTRGKRYGPRSFRVAAPRLFGTIYHDVYATMTLVVNNIHSRFEITFVRTSLFVKAPLRTSV